ncbi:MAG: folate-binding protein [Alteraurantiacibacter sp.]
MSRPLLKRALVRIVPTDPAEDAIGFVQGLVTNDVTALKPGRCVYAGLLTPQGKTLFDLFVWPLATPNGPGLLLDVEAKLADELVAKLSLYRLRRKVEIAVEPNAHVSWAAPEDEAEEAKGTDPRLPELGFRSLLHLAPSGAGVDDAYLEHRLALGVPEGRAEMGDVLWLETNAGELNGVSFTKGCYIGQENTARMNWRAKINRRLVVLPLAFSKEERRKATYRDLELAVDLLRLEDIPRGSLPDWVTRAEAGA